ncbi:type II toxin-antitoxin system HipA family toxin [Pseudomonas turukhanskensis]|uniref:Phosphatidylinositol kinase n=1 Tax=Pseudomonas turukhanskensis TaxID=1806536 RepID=A0A9W6K282_9PSED|nr:HipA domain-containing protein [Pseudomonas turukhanskensis]GLK87437.1 phosphatidylinositol kinase [Pseudomonas turukhanskensis]
MKLTVQVHDNGEWKDAFWVKFNYPENGLASSTSYGYAPPYVVDHLDESLSRFEGAVSYRYPISFNDDTKTPAPAFLHDIAPAGAARQSLLRRLGPEKPEGQSADVFLLGRCTPAPIGNLRIKESAAYIQQFPPVGFSQAEVIELNTAFVEHAYDQGAAIGGASGAGGAAPKILMTQDAEGMLHPDASLPDEDARMHWFIKFPRGKATREDIAILRSEFLYYRAINQLGLDTISTEGLSYFESERPSLWMKRFDREIHADGVRRLAVESVYSLAGVVTPGQHMQHEQVVKILAAMWTYAGQQEEIPALLSEYLRRDLLNRILGNTDNHGRNTSVIREKGRFRLAPIYDLAPMAMDSEVITRTTKWNASIERGGLTDWVGACMALSEYAEPDALLEQLKADASLFMNLPDILQPDLPAEAWRHPGIHLARLEDRLTAWGLL